MRLKFIGLSQLGTTIGLSFDPKSGKTIVGGHKASWLTIQQILLNAGRVEFEKTPRRLHQQSRVRIQLTGSAEEWERLIKSAQEAGFDLKSVRDFGRLMN